MFVISIELCFNILSVGHKGKFGHEFLEFEFRPNGRLRYSNNSNYRSDSLIRKEVYVQELVLKEIKKIISDSEILRYLLSLTINSQDDENWPKPDKVGSQELEIVLGDKHISFTTSKIGSYGEVQKSQDPNGLLKFYYLVQDLKSLVFSIISLHFRVICLLKLDKTSINRLYTENINIDITI